MNCCKKFLSIAIFSLLPIIGHADVAPPSHTITLTNGDILRGEIISQDDTTLIFKHATLGQLTLPVAAIAAEPAETDAAPDIVAEEPVKKSKKKDKTQFRIEGSGEFADGNNNRQSYNAQGEYKYRETDNRYTVRGNYYYGESNGQTDADNANLLGKYDRFLNEKLYWFSNANYTRDDFKDIQLRLSLGSGLGYQILDTDRTSLKAELGPNYVHEETENKTLDYPGARWMIDFNHDVIQDIDGDTRLEAFHFQEGLMNIRDRGDISVRSETGLRVPVYQGWHAFGQANVDFENEPAGDAEAFDTIYLVGFGYRLGVD